MTEALASKQAESWVSRRKDVYVLNLNNEEDAKAAANDIKQEACVHLRHPFLLLPFSEMKGNQRAS